MIIYKKIYYIRTKTKALLINLYAEIFFFLYK